MKIRSLLCALNVSFIAFFFLFSETVLAKGVNRDGPFPHFVKGVTQVSTANQPFEGLELRMATRFRDWNDDLDAAVPVEKVEGASRYRVFGEIQLVVDERALPFRMTDFMVYENDSDEKHFVVTGESDRYLDKIVIELMLDEKAITKSGDLMSLYVGKVYYFAPNAFKNRFFKAGLFENGFPVFVRTEKTD